MATLTNTKIKDTYDSLLKISDNGIVEATEQVVTDGLGNNTVLSIGTASASFSSDIEVNGVTVGKGNSSVITNTALGRDALDVNTTGSFNTAIGSSSMNLNTTGGSNVAVGASSLASNVSSSFNTAIGVAALQDNTASSNTAVGYISLSNNTTGINNTAVGTSSLLTNTTGAYNTSVGKDSLYSNTEGDYNAAFGISALYSNSEGNFNTAIGAGSLYFNTASSNTAVGHSALSNNTTGSFNTAVGKSSLLSSTTGTRNVAVGYFALESNTEGGFNTAVGSDALRNNTTASNNTAVGYVSLFNNTTGEYNTASGYGSLEDNTTGDGNTAFGTTSLTSNTEGNHNTALGYLSLNDVTTGDGNVGVGFNTGNTLTTGSNNIYVGYGIQASAADSSNEIVIGASATGNGSNTATYGNSSITSHHFTSGQVNVAGNLAVDTNTLYVDAANNSVGIGTSSVYTETGYKSLTINDATYGGVVAMQQLGTTVTKFYGDSSGARIESVGARATRFFNNGSETMRIDSDGNVLVGTTNAVPISDDGAVLGASGYVYASRSSDIALFANRLSTDGDVFVIRKDGSTVSSFGVASNGLTISTGGSEKMRIDSSGNVGIGESNPSSTLSLKGAGTYVATINNTAQDARVSLQKSGTEKGQISAGDSSLNLYGIDNLRFLVGGGASEAMRIDSSGNVIIKESAGAFTPATNGLSLSTGYGVSYLFSKSSGGTEADMYYNAANQIFNTGGTERMRIDSSGTTHITSSKAYGNQTATLRVQTIPTGTNYTDGAFNNIVFGNESIANGYLGQIAVVQENASASTATTMRFFTNTGGGNDATSERMRIDSAGNVGIGTSSPAYLITANSAAPQIGCSVSGTSALRIAADGTQGYIFEPRNLPLTFSTNGEERMRITSEGYVGVGTGDTDIQSGDLIGVLAFNSSDSSTNSAGAIGSIRSYASAAFNTGQVSGDLRFYTQDAGAPNGSLLSGSERMRITSGGDVLVGKQSASLTTAGVRLAPNGTSEFIAQGNDNSPLTIGSADDVSLTLVTFTAGGGTAGSISISGGTSTSYNTSSDYRLKENVVPMEGALDRVDALKPSRFNFISDPEKTVDGFLAHEVAEVVPEAIYGEKDAVDEEGNPIYQGIDQSKIVPLLVGAIKELKAEIELLKSQING